ncbi:MAG: hypothetical protein ACTSX6_11365 [Candidatus Heimdallarchaeaceae archaeon]
MKNKKNLVSFLLITLLIIPTSVYSEKEDKDFRTVSFTNQGFDIVYKVVQGENVQSLFSNFLGFSIKGSFTNSEYHIILKNRREELKQIYFIEKGEFVSLVSQVFSFNSYLLTGEIINLQINTSSQFLKDVTGFNFQPVENEEIPIDLPQGSSLVLPNIFSNITRPNFGSLLKTPNFFDFLPIILGEDYERYEAEFTTLTLNQSFSASIFNENYDEFSLALDINLNPSISIKASWNKENGLLTAFSLHVVENNKSSIFVISLKEINPIVSPLESNRIDYFITNSFADYTIFQQRNSTEDQLNNWAYWVNQLNQTNGFRYNFIFSGLDIKTILYIYNKDSHSYSFSTPIHNSWVSLIYPIILPLWERFFGTIKLINGFWEQLYSKLIGYQFILSGVTETLYTLRDANLRLQYQEVGEIVNVIWEFSLDYQSNNTQTVVPRVHVQETEINMTGWLAYKKNGQLKAFSQFYQEHYHSYYDPAEPSLGNNYFFEYYIESAPENLTKPDFIETEKTSLSVTFMQIIFYSIFVYQVYRRNKKKNHGL